MDSPSKPNVPKYPVGAADRVLRMLLLLSEGDAIGVTGLAQKLGVGASTAHRLIQMLVLHGFATQDESTRLYSVGPALKNAGLRALAPYDLGKLRNDVRPYLEALANRVGETAHLVIRNGMDCVFVDAVLSEETIISSARVGRRIPAYATSGGKALLAELSPGVLARLLRDNPPQRITGQTISEAEQLESELAEVRRNGYAVNLGESETGIGAAAAVLRNRAGGAFCALTATAPVSRLEEKGMDFFIKAVVDTSRDWLAEQSENY